MATELLSENDNLNNEIIQWSCNYLVTHGYTLKSNLPENVLHRPWSYVVRFVTSDGYIYLKHTPRLLALEATITQILHDQFHASVPEVIAHNTELNCFLMKDAGRPLREILKKHFNAALLCKGIDEFTSMQRNVADHVNIFLDIGVPDWRLDKLADLFKQVLAKTDILMADGLSEIEISELEKLLPKIANLCKRLSDYSIKQTIIQPDFHDNNLLINEISKNITIIDLGEIVVSHPFFSLITCLKQAKKHHALTDEDDAYQQLMDACLTNYLNIESKQHLLDAFAIAQRLWFVYEALANDRLMAACGKEKLMSFQPGKLSGILKELMTACNHMDDELIALYRKRLNLQDANFSRIEHSDAIIATVYKISEPNDKEYILKICPRDKHYFCETYFLKYFADSLPVPHIVKAIEPTLNVNGAILMEYLSGSLFKKEDLTDSLAYEIGSLLARIHCNKANGYGDLTQPNKLSPDASDYFTFKFEEGFNECKGNLPDAMLDQCHLFYNNNIQLLDFVDGPCVVHRDFRPGNVIVNNNRVQGIIDWSGACASFAEEDFYPLEFGKWTNSDVLKKSFLEGYASIRPVPAYDNVMPLLALSRAMATIGFTVRSDTWRTKNASLYQRKRQFLEKFIGEHFNNKNV